MPLWNLQIVMVTVLDVLRGAADYLGKRGIENPRLNAEHLLAHVLGCKRLELYLAFDRPLGEAERAPLRELVRARGEGRPLQHLLGTVEFLGHVFACDARALIPRPETEQFVELALGRLPSEAARLADVGTGSGVIAISMGLKRPSLEIIAVDASPEALALAGENAARHGVTIAFQVANLLPESLEGLDGILANLPYIPTAELAALDREVRHDPQAALDGGPDGMEVIRRLIALAPAALKPGGLLGLEIGEGQAEALGETLQRQNFRDIESLEDYQGRTRFLFARHG